MLIPGDCSVGSEELEKWIGKRRINAVLLDFPWITSEAGRKYVAEVIQPEYAIVCHLPRAGNDRFGYREATKKGIELLNKDITALLLSEDFTSVFLKW